MWRRARNSRKGTRTTIRSNQKQGLESNNQHNSNHKQIDKMKKTIGGQRLGSGNKMNVDLHNYGRSTHNLDRVWRSSMAAGTLVPFMTEIGLNGDTFDIQLNSMVRTMPTLGPLFGSFKLQLDIFQIPMRLYMRDLHNNKLDVGMNMKNVILPTVTMQDTYKVTDGLQSFEQSSLAAYLGMRGIGSPETAEDIVAMERRINALPYIAYYDIFKNYYANKQEDDAYLIAAATDNAIGYPVQIVDTVRTWSANQLFDAGQSKTIGGVSGANNISIIFGGESMDMPQWAAGLIMLDKETGDKTKLLSLMSGVKYINNTVVGFLPQGKTFEFDQLIQGAVTKQTMMRAFPLNLIDEMREKLLDTKIVQFTAADKLPLHQVCGKMSSQAGFGTNGWSYNRWSQNGLCVKTYQSDIFNNWLDTEWIDGPNGINEITKVAVADGAFKLDALNLAQKVYNMLNRVAVSGGSYYDWQEAVYGDDVMRQAETPMYMGGLSTEIVFDEVVSTAATTTDENNPLGSLAGRGTQNGRGKGGNITIKVKEPSIIMGIVSITPRIDYCQGNKWYNNINTMDDWHKPALDGIGYQELITEQMHWAEAKLRKNDAGYKKLYSAGKQPAWINYMTAVNETYGDFATEEATQWMCLTRRYDLNSNMRIGDLTTYIDPQKYNYAFADTALDAQNFWVQIGADVTARRKMSAKQIPNL